MKKIKNYLPQFAKNKKLNIGAYIASVVLLALSAFFASRHLLEFAFVDEYNNWVIGHYLLQGEQLYSDIYLNHQMLIAYLSTAVQFITQPDSLYQLAVFHRLSVIAISLLLSAALIFRFRLVGILFVAVYEFSKYYLFGNLLLGESIIAYLAAYNAGLVLEKFNGKKLSLYDIFASSIITYLIIFLREPYGPLALFLFACVLFGRENFRVKKYAVGLFVLLTVLTLLTVPLKEYIFQVIYVNATTVFASESGNTNFLGSGIYPLMVFLHGEWTFLRMIEIFLSTLLIASTIYLLWKKKFGTVLFLFVALSLAGIRLTTPGREFYVAFHMLPYFALLAFIPAFIIVEKVKEKNMKIFGILAYFAIIVFLVVYPNPYVRESNTQETFFQQYSLHFVNGEVVNRLSEGDETLFVHGYDSLIFTQANTEPAFEYILFYPEMNAVEYFVDKRTEMFEKSPPTYYFQDCITDDFVILDEVKKNYTPMIFNESPTCLFIHNDKVNEIRQRIQKIEDMGYSI